MQLLKDSHERLLYCCIALRTFSVLFFCLFVLSQLDGLIFKEPFIFHKQFSPPRFSSNTIFSRQKIRVKGGVPVLQRPVYIFAVCTSTYCCRYNCGRKGMSHSATVSPYCVREFTFLLSDQ